MSTGSSWHQPNSLAAPNFPTDNPDIKISLVIPAHNEEAYLPAGLEAVARASERSPYQVETIVVVNRCTDRTEEIAQDFGARVVHEDAKNLARIRNTGLAAATGKIIMTVDADSRLHRMAFADVVKKLKSGKYIGGGSLVFPERYSLGIFCSAILLLPHLFKYRVSFGSFWTTREACDTIGGFDETFITIEDVDFAVRLKKLGKERGQKFGTLYRAALTTSCRKFDEFGDWHFFRERDFLRKVFTGRDAEVGNRYWYEPDR